MATQPRHTTRDPRAHTAADPLRAQLRRRTLQSSTSRSATPLEYPTRDATEPLRKHRDQATHGNQRDPHPKETVETRPSETKRANTKQNATTKLTNGRENAFSTLRHILQDTRTQENKTNISSGPRQDTEEKA